MEIKSQQITRSKILDNTRLQSNNLNKKIMQKSSINDILNYYQKKDEDILLKIRDVNVVFGKRKNKIYAVKNFNLNVYKGEILGLIGESGSGKSTIGNSILGLINRQSGSIKLKGLEIPNKSKKIKGKIHKFMVKSVQMIFQDPASSLNPYKNVYEIVSEGLKNVSVKQIYTKTFDSFTAIRLHNLLEGKKQPKSLHKISLEWINENIIKESNKVIENALYGRAIEDLLDLDTSYGQKAAIYLLQRKMIRKNYIGKSISRKQVEERLVIDVIESVGLSKEILSRYPLEFSGGQQQRLGISRAVVLKPELIVADEPISALDVSIQAQVINILNELKEKLNLTLLFIAHDLRMVEYVSNRIAVMYQGEIVEIGEAKEIINNPIHPYTRSLINSIPTIDKIKKSLRSDLYISPKTNEETNKFFWYKVQNSQNVQHFVLAREKDVEKMKRKEV